MIPTIEKLKENYSRKIAILSLKGILWSKQIAHKRKLSIYATLIKCSFIYGALNWRVSDVCMKKFSLDAMKMWKLEYRKCGNGCHEKIHQNIPRRPYHSGRHERTNGYRKKKIEDIKRRQSGTEMYADWLMNDFQNNYRNGNHENDGREGVQNKTGMKVSEKLLRQGT